MYFPTRQNRHIATILISLSSLNSFSQTTIPPLGQWRTHLDYQSAIQVVKGDKIYCAGSSSVFSVTADGAMQQYDKVSGLNDVGVRCIAWDAATKQLLIAYNNSNIDVMRTDGNVRNIGDIKRSQVTGDKTINGVYCRNGLAYIASGLGIIVANLDKYEIKDTWRIGSNGSQLNVNAVVADDTNFYAATAEGLKSIAITDPNPSDFSKWQAVNGSSGLTAGALTTVLVNGNKLVVQKNDSLLVSDNGSWRLLYAEPGWQIQRVTASENKFIICQRTTAGISRVLLMNTNGVIEKTISQPLISDDPREGISDNGATWIADFKNGLLKISSGIEKFIPNGPAGLATGEMATGNNTVYVAAGGVTAGWLPLQNRKGLYFFTGDSWTSVNAAGLPAFDSIPDIVTLAVDPSNNSVWAGSFGGGLVNINGSLAPKIYKGNNSTLQTGNSTGYRVSGLAFDRSGNLWVSNYGASQNLHVRKTDSSWKAFSIPFTHAENAVSQIVVDDNNQLWIVSPKDNGLFCFNYGESIDALSDDKWKYYRLGSGSGNLPSNTVLSIAKDRNGFIWVGTDHGIGIIRCSGDVFSSGCDAVLPVVQQDQFAGLLFKDESVQCIAVDGANRKWIGTKNGLWLVSQDGSNIVYRFTAENSPLLGNDVNHITIEPVTGEVFIATSNGICSFRSTATEPLAESASSPLVFPNPVPPGYNGTIAIRGFARDMLVKITELSGKLVYQTRSLGGQAVWNGMNYKGEKAASGVYLVIARDDDGVDKIVTKIVMIAGR